MKLIPYHAIRKIVLSGFAAYLSTASVALSETLARYEFSGTTSSAVTPASATPSAFLDGPGYNIAGATGFSSGRRYVLSQAIQSSSASACITNGDYFQFSVSPSSGQALNLESLLLTTVRGATSPDRVSVFTSVDGFTTPVLNNAPVSGSGTVHTVNLTGPEFQGLTAITLRIVGHGNNVNLTSSTPRISYDNVTLNGTVTPVSTIERWSNPATWGGSVPTAGQNVVVPEGKTVLLDVNTAALGVLDINGTLRFDPTKDLNLTAHHIVVHHGLLEIGTVAAPYTKKATITLTGSNPAENILVHEHSTGAKGLIVMGGTLEIHGHRASAASWTKLNGTANVGATQIQVVNTNTGWRVGDQIVVAPSGFNMNEAEKVTITAIANGSISFSPALQFRHFGATQTMEGKVLDMRAEVALLTRDIVIQGDATSDSNFYGGHVMIHHGGFARAQGVEFRKMGQRGKQGRYPWHWHLTGDCTGQWIKNSSVHDSFHRAYATHRVDNAEVNNCVAYDVWSHIFVFSEDGPEYHNIYRNNIGIKCKTLAKEHFAFLNSAGDSSQNEKRASVFWGKRPNQIIENNVAVGTDSGHGFFFDPTRGEQVFNGEVTSFSGNVAHAIAGGLAANITYPPGSEGSGLFVQGYKPNPMKDQNFGDFFAYKCTAFGIWIEQADQYAFDSMTADCGAGLLGFSANYSNILIAGSTNNDVGGLALPIGAVRKNPGVLGGDNHGGAKRLKMSDITFVNLRDEAVFWWAGFTTHGMSSERARLVNTPKRVYFPTLDDPSISFHQPGFLFDKDGSLTGTGEPTALMLKGSPIVTANSTFVPAYNGYRHRVVPDGTELILDNTSSGVAQTGSWSVAASPAGFYGSNYLSDGNAGKGSKSVLYTPNLPAASWYRLSLRYPAGAGFSSVVPVDVLSDTGAGNRPFKTGYAVNQTTNGGIWNPVDYLWFQIGTTGNLTISNAGTTGTVAADALRIQRMILE